MRTHRALFTALVLSLGCNGQVAGAVTDAGLDAGDDAVIDTAPSPRSDAGRDAACTCPATFPREPVLCACTGLRCSYRACDGTSTDVASCSPAGTFSGSPMTCDRHDFTTGKPCTDDTACDVYGDGANRCVIALFPIGTIYPTPVCVGRTCDPGDGTALIACDGATGLCVPTTIGAVCLPACGFEDDGKSPTGCYGKDGCIPRGWGDDATGRLHGVGFCFGGCTRDDECTRGDVCQVETALCVKARVTFAKALGDPCTNTDVTAGCACAFTVKGTRGYCSQRCVVGGAACPTGFSCDSGLPRVDDKSGATLFTKAPVGLLGRCLKDCVGDVDCAAYGPSRCLENAGTGRKTCQVSIDP